MQSNAERDYEYDDERVAKMLSIDAGKVSRFRNMLNDVFLEL